MKSSNHFRTASHFFKHIQGQEKMLHPKKTARSEDCIERLWDTSCLFGWSWVDWSGTPRPDAIFFKMLRESFSNLVLFFGKIIGSRKPHYEKKHTCFFWVNGDTWTKRELVTAIWRVHGMRGCNAWSLLPESTRDCERLGVARWNLGHVT